MEEEWSRKGATLSDKTARKELGLTQEERVFCCSRGSDWSHTRSMGVLSPA